MGIQIDTATDHVDLHDRLVAWLEAGSESPGWTLLDYDSGGPSSLWLATGLTATDEIYVGFSLHENVGADAYALAVWMFKDYNAGLGHLEQPGHSARRYLPLWDAAMPYWFVANGQRVIVVTKVSTVYSALYAGRFLPYGTPGEYPQPLFYGATHSSASTRWSSTHADSRNFWDPGGGSARLHLPAGTWHDVQNWAVSGASETTPSSTIYVEPFAGDGGNSQNKQRYQELRESPDGSYPLWELTLAGEDPGNEIYGTLDGVFAVSGFGNAAENVVQAGGVDHLVVQNLFRTNRYDYAAIALE